MRPALTMIGIDGVFACDVTSDVISLWNGRYLELCPPLSPVSFRVKEDAAESCNPPPVTSYNPPVTLTDIRDKVDVAELASRGGGSAEEALLTLEEDPTTIETQMVPMNQKGEVCWPLS